MKGDMEREEDVGGSKQAEELLRDQNEELEATVEELRISEEELASQLEELQKSRDALKESEEKYRLLSEFTWDWVYWLDNDYRFVYCSPSCERITGYAAEEFFRDPALLQQIVHPEDRALMAEHRKVLHSSAEHGELEFRIVRRDGGVRWIEHVCKPIVTAEGSRLGRRSGNRDITERKQAEEALKESEMELQTAQRIARMGSWRLESATNHVVWTEGLYRMFGLSPSLPPPDYTEHQRLFTPESWARLSIALSRTQEAGVPYELELEMVRPGENNGWMLAFGEPVRDASGAIVGLRGAAQDITERKRMEDELRISKDRLLFATEGANLGVWNWDTVTGELIWSDKCKALFGVPPEETMSYPRFSEALHPDDRERTDRAVKDALDNHKDYDIEYRSLWPDGSVHWLAAKGRGYYDATGKDVRLEGVVLDITERKRAEEALHLANAYNRSLIEASLDPLVTIGRDGKIADVNAATEKVTGYSRQDLVGNDFLDYFMEPEKARAGYQRVFKEGYVVDYPLEIRHKDGRITSVLYNASVYRDEKGEVSGVFAAARDITERKRAEEAIKRYAADLKRSNEELQQFAYVASHDLQEPLRAVASFTQLLSERYKGRLDKDADEFIAFAVGGAHRMQALINDLLSYSRLETRGKPPEPTDSHDALGQALANLGTAIRESVALVTNEDLPTVRADESQLVQLFQNLVGNAIKFRGPEPPRVHVSAVSKGNEWLFSVRDNGIGIAKEYHERIFSIFQRLHSREEYPGTGIGLALCKRIVERHGGTIRVESGPGSGSTFFFTLPKP
jgi:PAS domain S-box-containing protein